MVPSRSDRTQHPTDYGRLAKGWLARNEQAGEQLRALARAMVDAPEHMPRS
jgi:hypothetical protein